MKKEIAHYKNVFKGKMNQEVPNVLDIDLDHLAKEINSALKKKGLV